MADISLQEAAARSGVPYQLLKKHSQRGQLKTRREGARVLVNEDDFELYRLAHALERAGDAVREGPANGISAAFREVGNVIARLPAKVQSAILEGMPVVKKAGSMTPGSPEPFRAAIADIPKMPEVDPVSDDPHFGKPVGFQYMEPPRWKRINASTWAGDGSMWSWNGMFWEGSGDALGRTLADGVSPSNPYSDLRPTITGAPKGKTK